MWPHEPASLKPVKASTRLFSDNIGKAVWETLSEHPHLFPVYAIPWNPAVAATEVSRVNLLQKSTFPSLPPCDSNSTGLTASPPFPEAVRQPLQKQRGLLLPKWKATAKLSWWTGACSLGKRSMHRTPQHWPARGGGGSCTGRAVATQ